MAQLTEINQIGKREDLRDFISIVDMKEKPFLAMVPKIQEAQNMLMSWQADAYAVPSIVGIADGVDVDSYENTAATRGLIQNFCQKFRRTAMVGDEAENVSNVAGAKAGELARALDKQFEVIGRDMESAFCSDNDAVLETGPGTPYQSKALGTWITTTGGAVLTVPAAFRPPAASFSTGAVTEAAFKTQLASIFAEYGRRQNLVCLTGTTGKGVVTNFIQSGAATVSSIRSFTASLDSKAIISNITTYEGDFNTVEMHPSLLLGVSAAGVADAARWYILPMEMLGLAFNRQPKVQRLPNLGGGPRAYIDAIAGLVVKNPRGFGKSTTIS